LVDVWILNGEKYILIVW